MINQPWRIYSRSDEKCLAYHAALKELLPRKDGKPGYMQIRRRALSFARSGHALAAHAGAKRIADPDELAAIEGLIFGKSLQAECETETYLAKYYP